MNYNIFGRWENAVGLEGQSERLKAIPQSIAANSLLGQSVDVITIEEAWCGKDAGSRRGIMCGSNQDDRDQMLAEFRK